MPQNEEQMLFVIEQLKRSGTFNMDVDHMHNTYEIYYLLAGERNYYINNLVYALRKGDLIFINRNELHRTTAKGKARHERILVNFGPRFLHGLTGQLGLELPFMQEQCLLLRPDDHEQGAIENLLFAMLEEQQSQRSQHLPYLQTLLAQLLIAMNRLRENASESIAPVNDEKRRKAYEISEYLQAHYAEKVTLPQLAEHFYISGTYLCRLFKQSTGFTLIEYLNTIRIQEAQRRLRDTDEPVTRIAEETGFDSIAHFGRVFKALSRRSPLQYRKQSR